MPYIADLDVAVPVDTLLVSSVPETIRNLTAAVKTTFPNVAGEVTATEFEIERLVGVTDPIQTQLNAKSSQTPLTEPTITFTAAVTSGFAHINLYDNGLAAIEIGGAISEVVVSGGQLSLTASITVMTDYFPAEAANSVMLLPCQFVTNTGLYIPGFIDFNAVGITLYCWNPTGASITLVSFCARGTYRVP